MAGEEESGTSPLVIPSVADLRQSDRAGKVPMERTVSMDIREERDDLKAAAEQSLNVILDLGLDGTIRWVSPSWKDVIGTPAGSVKGVPIAEILLSDGNAFADAVESMKKDDSRSQIVRFQVLMGPDSVLRQRSAESDPDGDRSPPPEENVEEERVLNLEGQGIMVYDRTSGGESHVRMEV